MAGKRKLEFDIIAKDNFSYTMQRVASGTVSMASKVNSSLIKTNNAFRQYNNSMIGYNRAVRNLVYGTAGAVVKLTKDSIDSFTELEKQHAETMGAMANNYDKSGTSQKKFFEDQKKLRNEAIRLGIYGPNGKGSMFTSTEISKAQTELIKSGRTADEVTNSGAASTILKFAGGNNLSLDDATTFAVNLGTQFNIPMEKWGGMLDQVTRAADLSVISVEDIMESMKYAGGVASSLGRPLDEVLAAVGVMGNAGLKGSMAGTGTQAFFTRILSPVGKSEAVLKKAPGIAGQVLDAFVQESMEVDANGFKKFKPMEDVTDKLNDAMSLLDDQEKAWFTQKLFGLFQAKAGFALSKQGVNGTNAYADMRKLIQSSSDGINDTKNEIMTESQYGKETTFKNTIQAVKTDVGKRLSPATSAVYDELRKFFMSPDTYKIDWTLLKKKINESGEDIADGYGTRLGEMVSDLGNMGIDASRIGMSMEPFLTGIAGAIGQLISGDPASAGSTLVKGLSDTNKTIDGLPEDLQGMARGVRNTIIALTALSSLNFATRILETITSVFKLRAKISTALADVKAQKAQVTSTKTDVNAAGTTVYKTTTTTINGSSLIKTNGTMTANTSVMTVKANIVNILSGTKMPKTGIPGWQQYSPGLGPKAKPGLGDRNPGKSSAMPKQNADGSFQAPKSVPGTPSSKTLKNVDITKSSDEFIKEAERQNGKKAPKINGSGTMLTLLAYAAPRLFGSSGLLDGKNKRVSDADKSMNAYISQGSISGKPLSDIIKTAQNGYMINDWGKDKNGGKDIYGDKLDAMVKAEVEGRYKARQELMNKFMSPEGAKEFDKMMKSALKSDKNISGKELQKILTSNVNGYKYTGTQDDLQDIFKYVYNNANSFKDFKGIYNGLYAEDSISSWFKSYKDRPTLNNFVGGNGATDVSKVMNLLNRGSILGELDKSKQQNNITFNPNVTVNVTVDSAGNVKSKSVLMNNVNDFIRTESSRWGGGK